MTESEVNEEKKMYVPGQDEDGEEIFDFPFLKDEKTVDFLENHGQIMFIVRGPPGTGKTTLSSLLCDRYPDGIVCCANHYFQNTFNTPTRNKQSLADSHLYCQKKVKAACENKSNVVIVQNTHIRRREMQKYLDYAAEYNYTVIMAITIRKFIVTPEILVKSNSQGLTKEYFERRLKQWEEVVPVSTGWFICPDDSLFIYHQFLNSLQAVLDDGKFCRVFDVFDKEQNLSEALLDNYQGRRQLFCRAASFDQMQNYYLSDAVQKSYGKAFDITLDGFLIHSNFFVAVVHVDYITEGLTKVTNEDQELESFFQSQLSLNDNLLMHNEVLELSGEFPESGKTACLQVREENTLTTANRRFILLANATKKKWDLNKIEEKSRSLIESLNDLEACSSRESEDDSIISRLPDDAWYIQPNSVIQLKSVFTGLYI